MPRRKIFSRQYAKRNFVDPSATNMALCGRKHHHAIRVQDHYGKVDHKGLTYLPRGGIDEIHHAASIKTPENWHTIL